jgi:hypothetical protein
LAQIQRGLDRGRGSTLCVRGSMWGARESVTWGARGSILRTRSVARGWAGPIGWLGGLGDGPIGPSPRVMNSMCVYIYIGCCYSSPVMMDQ